MAPTEALVSPLLNKAVVPGAAVLTLPESGHLRVGGGLQPDGEHLVASKAGILRASKAGKLWVEGRQKRYIPAVDEQVIGVVLETHAENLNVDVGGPFPAALSVLAFEGATRRNRPNLNPGDLVFCRVLTASKDLEPTLSCVDAAGKASGFGPLKDGFVVSSSTALARRLLARPPCAILTALGKQLQYEVAVGVNGRVWIRSPSAATTVLVANAILKSEYISDAQCEALVKGVLKKIRQEEK